MKRIKFASSKCIKLTYGKLEIKKTFPELYPGTPVTGEGRRGSERKRDGEQERRERRDTGEEGREKSEKKGERRRREDRDGRAREIAPFNSEILDTPLAFANTTVSHRYKKTTYVV
jgi:hypothetical protein